MTEHTPGPLPSDFGRATGTQQAFEKVVAERDRLREVNAELLAAANLTLLIFDNMTTEKFQLGHDRPAREALAVAVAKATTDDT